MARATKLTSEQLAALIAERRAGAKLEYLAAVYGLHVSTVSRILKRELGPSLKRFLALPKLPPGEYYRVWWAKRGEVIRAKRRRAYAAALQKRKNLAGGSATSPVRTGAGRGLTA